MLLLDDDNVTHRSFIHAQHVRATQSNPDTHVIKERIYFKDGTQASRTYCLENYKVPFYITLPKHRTYKQHKEREHLSRLARHESTVSDLPFNIARALGQRSAHGSLKDVCNSPYVFGAQFTSTARLRYEYQKRWPVPPKPLRYGAYDLETSVVDANGAILIASLAFEDQVKVFIRQDFIAAYPQAQSYFDNCHYHFAEHGYGDLVKNAKFSFVILPDELSVIKALAQTMFEFDLDIAAAWNHEFDVTKLISRCQALNVDPADIFSDPVVPANARRFKFLEGARVKATASKEPRPLAPSEQWHNVLATSGFFWIDAMCTYRQLRQGAGSLQSYALDYIASLHLGVGKLETKETQHMDSLSRHVYMQTKDPLTYCLYAALDVYEMILIDRKTKDISHRLTIELSGTDYNQTNRSSTRTADMFFFELDKEGYVLGTVGSKEDEFPRDVLPVSGWPLPLPNNLHAVPGIKALEELPDYATNIYTCNLTTDLTSAYPTLISIMNISKETTVSEFVELTGMNCSQDQLLLQNMNIFGGRSNALDYAQAVYGYPTLMEIDQLIEAQHAVPF